MCGVTDDTVKQPQFSSDVTNLCCESCVIVKDQLLQVFQELKSARTIITLLQEDIVKLNFFLFKMAAGVTQGEPTEVKTLELKGIIEDPCCVECLVLETRLKETIDELSSAQVIIELLRSEVSVEMSPY